MHFTVLYLYDTLLLVVPRPSYFFPLMQICSVVLLIATDLRATASWILSLNSVLLVACFGSSGDLLARKCQGSRVWKANDKHYCGIIRTTFLRMYKSILSSLASSFKNFSISSVKPFTFFYFYNSSGNELSVLQSYPLISFFSIQWKLLFSWAVERKGNFGHHPFSLWTSIPYASIAVA